MTTGGPLSPALEEHGRGCPACRELVAALGTVTGGGEPAADTVDKIRGRVRADTTRVSPMPGTWALAAIFLAITFVAMVCGLMLISKAGYEVLSPVQRATIFGTLVLMAGTGAWMAAGSMRPAAGTVHGCAVAAGFVLCMEALFIVLFKSFDIDQFVPAGLKCLGLGLAFAIPVAILARLVMARGLVVAPVSAGLAAGLVGGLAGLLILEIHCPLLTVPHVGVWHVGVVVLAIAGGVAAALRARVSGHSLD